MTWRRPAAGALDVALLSLAFATAALGLVLSATTIGGLPWWDHWLGIFIAWAFAAVGLIAWWRRPHNRMGPLLLACGWSFLGLQMGASQSSAIAGAAAVVATLPLALIVHVLMAFPSGRLAGTPERVVVAAGYALATVLEAPVYLLGDGSPLQVASADGVATAVARGQSVAGTVVMVAGVGILVGRLRRADAHQRLVVGPVCAVGAVTLVVLPLLGLVISFELALPGRGALRDFAQPVLLLMLPITFLYGLLRGGFARAGEVHEMASRIASASFAPGDLRDAIAEALGDRSVALAYRSARDRGYVDADARPVALPAPGGARAAVEIASEGRRVGAIVYDALLISDPELVRTVAHLAAVALDRERLATELRAAASELRASRQRLAVASDAERRRIARDLHDGAQQRLVLLAIDAQRMARVADDADRVRRDATILREEVEAVLDDLRALVHNLEPALLTERGLPDATAWLVARMPIPTELDVDGLDERLPSIVESTGYFVVSEALANVVKHARGTRCEIALTADGDVVRIVVADDGVGGANAAAPGLRGLSDRLGAIDGTLTVDSPDGGGTRLVAELPIGDRDQRGSLEPPGATSPVS